MTKEEFNEKYCTVCGSQKCMGIFDEDWSEGCHTWKEVNRHKKPEVQKVEISEEDIQRQLKETMQRLGPLGKSKT